MSVIEFLEIFVPLVLACLAVVWLLGKIYPKEKKKPTARLTEKQAVALIRAVVRVPDFDEEEGEFVVAMILEMRSPLKIVEAVEASAEVLSDVQALRLALFLRDYVNRTHPALAIRGVRALVQHSTRIGADTRDLLSKALSALEGKGHDERQ